MERVVWTDERVDDLARRLDVGFDRVDCEIQELRREVGELRAQISRTGGGIIIGLVGVSAAIFATGV